MNMNKTNIFLVVTSINKPNSVLQSLSKGCKENNWEFILVGDKKSPHNIHYKDITYLSLQKQLNQKFIYNKNVPVNHYSRKNVGYLNAISKKAELIIETDDDNLPFKNFWGKRTRYKKIEFYEKKGWINIYSFFTNKNIWPRGFPLEKIKIENQKVSLKKKLVDCPIQQGLADDNPDVDAVYRLTSELPIKFKKNKSISLGKFSWCPFNSQNTAWWKDSFELLYLPAYCSFRMTDIWRSFVAQRICWENNWHINFHSSNVVQERNEHNLLNDFEDEIVGYLNNDKLINELDKLKLYKGKKKISENMKICYDKMISLGLIKKEELLLLEFWFEDIRSLNDC